MGVRPGTPELPATVVGIPFSELPTMIDENESGIALSPTLVAQSSISASASASDDFASYRRYKDGKLTDGQSLFEEDSLPSDARHNLFTLPYSSDQVIRRIASYDVLEELGRGAMGIVYKAYSLRLCRTVAIKVITSGEDASRKAIIRFHNEAVLAARLNHPNIVGVYDSGVEEGLHYFVMEYVEGQSLGDILKDSPFDLEQLLRWFAEIARALDYAHNLGVLHRDIKPDNIMIAKDGKPQLADFGLATEKVDENAPDSGVILGTPHYMPPEQANGESSNLGPASDVYALGATLYHALTGRPPFEGRSVVEVLSAVIRREPTPPSARVPDREIPVDVETICLKCLEKQSSRRYATSSDLAEELERVLEGKPILARPIGSVERFQKWARRNRPVLVGSFIVFSVLITLIAGFAAVTVTQVERSSSLLRERDREEALRQAKMVESAIVVAMLEGRADQARELLREITRADDKTGSIQVVRLNRSIAYGDKSTREFVEKRLNTPQVLDWIKKEWKWFSPKVEQLKAVGIPAIKKLETEGKDFVDIPIIQWSKMVRKIEPSTYTEVSYGIPELVVVRPIKNTPLCEICHGDEPKGYGPSFETDLYGSGVGRKVAKEVRAVLVVRRSQEALVETIEDNRRMTFFIGCGTAAAFACLMILFTRILGVQLGRQRFGSARR